MLGRDELDRRLAYHPPGTGTVPLYELNRALIRLTAAVFDATLPASRELALAQTALEDALMRANQAVACNLDPNAELPDPPDVATLLDDVLERLEGPILSRDGGRWVGIGAAGTPREPLDVPGTFSSPGADVDPDEVRELGGRTLDDAGPDRGQPLAAAGREQPPGPPTELEAPEQGRIRGDEGLEGPILTRSAPDEPEIARRSVIEQSPER